MSNQASRLWPARHANPRGRTLPLALVCGALACASGAGPLSAPAAPPVASDSVRVRLVFGASADLDLYVTGPSQETVYFANDRSRDGGQLSADRRCDAPAPRVESVLFPAAAPGLYRVGIDFPERCASGVERAAYLLVVDAPGREASQMRGEASFGRFASRVVEIRVEP